jgi:peptide/nickel transport system substrate-binding protein
VREGSAQLALDVAPAGPGEDGPRIVSRPGGLRVALLAFDVARERSPHASPPRNPFRDRRVRQAVALAIDRGALVKGLLGRAALSDQITAAQELGAYQSSVPARPFDPVGARRLLQETEFGRGFEVVLDTGNDSDSRTAAAAIARDLGRVGIRVRLRPQSALELARRLDARDTALCLRAWTSETGDGRVSYESLLHSPRDGRGPANVGGYSDPMLDRMLREASAPLTTDERRLLLARLATKVALDVPVVPLFTLADVYAVAEGLAFEPRLDGQLRVAEMRWLPR